MKYDYTKNKNWMEAQLRGRETFRLKCKLKKQTEIEEYNKNPDKCEQCGKDLKYMIKSKIRRFCNRACSGAFNNIIRSKSDETRIKLSIAMGGTGELKLEFGNCMNCNSTIKFNKRKVIKYCTLTCQQEYQYKIYIEKWKSGLNEGGSEAGMSNHVRRYIFEKFGSKCSECGWCKMHPITNTSTLQVDHIDGNPYNHKEENLILLCPNCHSLTPTYCGRNRGNGRITRRSEYRRAEIRKLELDQTIKDLQTSLI